MQIGAWRGVFATAAVAAMATAAHGADLALKAPPAPAAVYSWTGCYIGGQVGGGFLNTLASGAVAGGQVGCDYQFAAGWVAGAEAAGAWTGLKGSRSSHVTNLTTGATFPSKDTVGNDSLASVTARIGHTFDDHWLFYVKGGAAWTTEHVDDAFNTGVALDPSASVDHTGWTAGAGVEWAMTRNWSTTVEYNYYGFARGVTATASDVYVFLPNLKDNIQAVTVGLNYRF